MTGTVSDEAGVGRSMGGNSIGHQSHMGEALTEWRSSEQLENGAPSTSPPYWDMDDDDDFGPKPSELYGKYTWKIENFSQINKRELRSNAFEVGGYKWYILIYPQGCDVFNHLSLFLCVANHDKLLPGWSHFAQFTIAVVNKDPKKSKYSDTLHRFWKKEHDWGWKKFMELSKVLDGFIDGDTLIIKAQVQVIREKTDRPFRCLDCQYRRELVRVYLTNVEQICRRFVEERRGKLVKLIEDKAKWSSFCSFWVGVDQNARCRMSKEKSDMILKVVVKHFFIEKEVTSTLVMDSLYSGLRALEGQTKRKKGKEKVVEVEEMPNPIVGVEKDMFILVDDVLVLIERAALEPLPPKDDKGPQNRMKDGGSGEDFNKDSIERDEKHLTELGRRTVEIFVLAHIFSNKIEVAYQEAVAMRRQEELIREEEAAWQAEGEKKAKRSATEKEKKSKKKQAKQKKSSHKKDKGKGEKSCLKVLDKKHVESDVHEVKEFITDEMQTVVEKQDIPEDMSDITNTIDGVAEAVCVNSDDRDAAHVNCDNISEIHPRVESCRGGFSSLSSEQSVIVERKSPSVMDDSSSTCSTDSVPSVVINGPYKGNSFRQYKIQKSPVREKNQDSTGTCKGSNWANETDSRPSEPAPNASHRNDDSVSCKASESESEAVVHSLQDRIKLLEQHVVKKEEEVVLLQKKLSVKEKKTPVWSSPSSPSRNLAAPSPAHVPLQSESKTIADPVLLKRSHSNTAHQTDKVAPLVTSFQNMVLAKHNSQNGSTSKPASQQFASVSTPSSAPTILAAKSNVPVAPNVQMDPLLARSASAIDRLSSNASAEIHNTVRSYKNATMGDTESATSASFPASSSPLCNFQPSVVSSTPMYLTQNSFESGFSLGMDTLNPFQNRPHFTDYPPREMGVNQILQRGASSISNNNPNINLSNAVNFSSSSDEFPHLDIINDLLEDEHSIDQRGVQSSTMFRNFSFPQANPHPLRYANGGQVGGSIQNQWQVTGSDWPIQGMQNTESGYSHQIPGYSNRVSSNVNGYTVFRPSNGN